MAPFGRNFLKARLKNRSSSKEMEYDGKEIQVWVCQEEKVVSGLTKHTTCSDVVQALIEEHQTIAGDKSLLIGSPREYCLVERWRGFERALPPLTRILRLWRAWGDEKAYIQFVLVKTDASVPQPGWRSSETKQTHTKERQWNQGPAQYMKSMPVKKQKKMVKRAFRKLEKIKQGTTQEERDGMDSLIKLIISQDHTIRQQIRRIRELDLEIEQNELELRTEWAETDGGNCVKDAYFQSHNKNKSNQQDVSQFDETLYTSDGILQIEEQLGQHRELIQKLSDDIEKEIRSIWFQGVEDPQGAAASAEDEDNATELESIKVELENSMRNGLAIHSDLSSVQKELKQNDVVQQNRKQEFELLAAQLSALHTMDSVEQPHFKDQTKSNAIKSKVSLVLSHADVIDTDSDTGISSTHSQDSSSPFGEPLPPI
ncbi:ras association domain-containing protein 9 [Polyodon spathula]|uniref:ras association domain-containing protein 9 n=1 Tax=Polyodon spathula TaxID=7913 RepID=UPI001B7F4FC9|nr:ras association domain-containing protein 9 [Polyodon spathula]